MISHAAGSWLDMQCTYRLPGAWLQRWTCVRHECRRSRPTGTGLRAPNILENALTSFGQRSAFECCSSLTALSTRCTAKQSVLREKSYLSDHGPKRAFIAQYSIDKPNSTSRHGASADKARFLAGSRRELKLDQIPCRDQKDPKLNWYDPLKPDAWEGLQPLPPNTRAPEGEEFPEARRALWRHLNPKQPWLCPGCQQRIFKIPVLSRHLQRCCPDLFPDQAVLSVSSLTELDALEGSGSLSHLLDTAASGNTVLSERALELSFRQLDADGQPIKRSCAEVAVAMQLPDCRMREILRLAMKKIPLKHDDVELEVLYEDEHLLAVNKVAGVLTAPKHRFEGGSMVNQVLSYLGRTPNVLHRLDMYTSGVLLFGKTLLATRDIHRQFRQRSVAKSYLAISAGVPLETSFEVDAPIGRHDIDKMARVTKGASDSQEAHTAFRVLSANADVDLSEGTSGDFRGHVASADRGASLLRCFPLTGRTHQIRVHLGHVGHAIIGDDFYGTMGPWIPRQALHAETLTVDHPATGKRLQFRAPLPVDFAAAVSALGLAWDDDRMGGDSAL